MIAISSAVVILFSAQLTSCMQGYITGLGRPGMAVVLLVLYYIIFRIPTAIILKNIFSMREFLGAFLVSHIIAFGLAFIIAKICGKKTARNTKVPM